MQESKAVDSIYSISTQRAHAKVYCCANKYHISVLKDRAYSLFVQTTHPTKFTWDADLVSSVYENTHGDDAGLRSYVTQRCIDHYTSVLKDEKLVRVLNEHEPFIWKLGKDLKIQVKDYAQNLTQATTGLETLEVSLKAEKQKNVRLQQDLGNAKTKAAKDLVEAKKEIEKAKAEVTREVAYSTKMFEHLRGAKHCEHCGKGDKMATPVRQWNDEVGRWQYLLRCDACGWWWWFERDQGHSDGSNGAKGARSSLWQLEEGTVQNTESRRQVEQKPSRGQQWEIAYAAICTLVSVLSLLAAYHARLR